jgi:hypothetical protein
MLLNTALLIASILFGLRWNNKKISELKKPLPYIVYEMVEEVKKRMKNSPYFGEKPHYFTPPSFLKRF